MSMVKQSNYRPHLRSLLRATWAIAMKDWKVYWRYPLNAISAVLQPIVWLTPAYFMGRAFSVNGEAHGFAGYSGTTDYMSFILVGMALSNFIMAVFWGMGYALKNDMDAGVMESNWMCPLPRPLLLVGHTFSSIALTTITSLAMLLVAGALFGFHISGNVLKAIGALLPMLVGLYGFGFAFAALVMVVRESNTMVDVGSFVTTILSGAQFPVNVLPRWLLPLSLALPMTYGFDLVRGFLLNTRTVLPIPVAIGILIAMMFVLVPVGLWAFRKLERRVRVMGTLGLH
ncbi:MAG TPA: ABC transporter permease [Levilinea sp.]|nr:ABC transporter permease [Levilinea sp.]